MKALSMDLKQRAVALRQHGVRAEEAAKRLMISKSSVERAWSEFQQKGSLSPSRRKGRTAKLLVGHEDDLERWVEQRPESTLEELAGRLREEKSVVASVSSVVRALARLGLSFKKTAYAAEQDRPDVAAARSSWKLEQGDWKASCLVFLDETGVNAKMASLRVGGMSAPWLIVGSMNGEGFLLYVRTQLVPTLNEGDIVVCDNLSSHKVAGVRELIEKAGARLLYLTPYSPDLNPIEMAFSKRKTLLRKAAKRTFEDMVDEIAKAISKISPSDCRGFFSHANYASY